ncbi:MAG: RNA-binding protein [Planctomycetota bacterium]
MTNIYVGNLPYATQETDLIEHFSQWGMVDKATLVFDRETGRPRGFGFVEMDDDTEAQKAIESAHGAEFNGRPLTVNEARPRGSGKTTPTGSTTASTAVNPRNGSPTYASTAEPSRGYANHVDHQPLPVDRPAPKPQRATGGGYANHLYS